MELGGLINCIRLMKQKYLFKVWGHQFSDQVTMTKD